MARIPDSNAHGASLGHSDAGIEGGVAKLAQTRRRPPPAAQSVLRTRCQKAHASVALPLSVRPCGSRPNGVASTELAVIKGGWRY